MLVFAFALVVSMARAPLDGAPAPLEMTFVRVAPGTFMMGCSSRDEACSQDERPAHSVAITKPFEIGAYEVTQAQWSRVMGDNPSAIKGDNHPVEMVSKTDVDAFLSKLTARNDGYRYRLPTEAEWEYAARAGSTEPYSGPVDEIAWHAGNSEDESHRVGAKRANAWGLYDTAGNVREWVSDQYSATYYQASPAQDPQGPPPGQGRGGRRGRPGGPPEGGGPPTGGRGPRGQGPEGGGRGGRGGPPGGRDLPVIRGGAWDNPASYLRVSARYNYYGPTLRVSDLGFRVVRDTVAQ